MGEGRRVAAVDAARTAHVTAEVSRPGVARTRVLRAFFEGRVAYALTSALKNRSKKHLKRGHNSPIYDERQTQ